MPRGTGISPESGCPQASEDIAALIAVRLTQRDRDILFSSLTQHVDCDLLAGLLLFDQRQHVVHRLHSFPVNADDDVGIALVDLGLFDDVGAAA